MKKVLIVPDTHAPYEDKKAWALMIRAAKVFKPDSVVLLGDFADFYSVSSHSKDPNRANQMDKEVAHTIKLLKELKTLKAKEYVFIAGNHENRLERYLQDSAPELHNLISIPKLLQLKELGFHYVPYKQFYKIGKLHLTHDVDNAGRYAFFKALDVFQRNIVCGHTHRIGYAVEGNAEGKKHVTATFGWLGDINEVDYMKKVKLNKDWTLGFGLAYIEPNGNARLVPVPIVDYTALIEGKLVK